MDSKRSPGSFASLQEVADYVGVSVLTIRRRIKSGALPAYRAGNSKTLRVKWSDVDAMFTRVPTVQLNEVA